MSIFSTHNLDNNIVLLKTLKIGCYDSSCRGVRAVLTDHGPKNSMLVRVLSREEWTPLRLRIGGESHHRDYGVVLSTLCESVKAAVYGCTIRLLSRVQFAGNNIRSLSTSSPVGYQEIRIKMTPGSGLGFKVVPYVLGLIVETYKKLSYLSLHITEVPFLASAVCGLVVA